MQDPGFQPGDSDNKTGQQAVYHLVMLVKDILLNSADDKIGLNYCLPNHLISNEMEMSSSGLNKALIIAHKLAQQALSA